MAKYRDTHTGAVRESTTPLGSPYILVTEEASKEELKQEAERRGLPTTGSKEEIASRLSNDAKRAEGGSVATGTTATGEGS